MVESMASSLPVNEEASTYNEFFSNSLEDLKELKVQWYSAAEYFDLAYTKGDRKQIVVKTLKDYAVQALGSTVGHLGSLTYRINCLIDEKVDEISDTRLQVSNIEQRLQTCQAHRDKEGIAQQSLEIPSPKHNKRYTLPGTAPLILFTTFFGRSLNDRGQAAAKHKDFIQEDEDDWRVLRTAILSTIKQKTPFSSIKRTFAPPAPPPGTFVFAEKKIVSPNRSSSMISRSASLLTRSTSSKHFSQIKMDNSTLRKSASMRVQGEKRLSKDNDQISSTSKRFLKALLSRSKPRNDPVVHSYLDEQ